MNPAVSLMMYFKRQMSFTKMLCYWVAQLIGALLASALVWGSTSDLAGDDVEVIDGASLNRPPFLLGANTLAEGAITAANGFLLEFMGSVIFFFVIAQCALDERGVSLTKFPGLPIGLILVVVHICLIPFTGCGVNPARTFGPAMVTCMGNSNLCSSVVGDWWWIYWVGPFLASYVVADITLWMAIDVDGDDHKKTDGDAPSKETSAQEAAIDKEETA